MGMTITTLTDFEMETCMALLGWHKHWVGVQHGRAQELEVMK